jgi:hypothetical protein
MLALRKWTIHETVGPKTDILATSRLHIVESRPIAKAILGSYCTTLLPIEPKPILFLLGTNNRSELKKLTQYIAEWILEVSTNYILVTISTTNLPKEGRKDLCTQQQTPDHGFRSIVTL